MIMYIVTYIGKLSAYYLNTYTNIELWPYELQNLWLVTFTRYDNIYYSHLYWYM